MTDSTAAPEGIPKRRSPVMREWYVAPDRAP